MNSNPHRMESFTGLYQAQKNLRFELKPVGKTEDWIKKNEIIGVENDELVGKDATRAVNYKYAKLLLDEMHRLFIEDALNLEVETDKTQKLIECIEKLSCSDKIELDKDLQKAFKTILDKKADEWKEQYKKEMPGYWQEDIKELEDKKKNEKDKKNFKNQERIIKDLEKKCKDPKLNKSGIELLFSNEDTIKILEWKIRSKAIQPTFEYLKQSKSQEIIPTKYLNNYLREFDGFHTYFSGFNENRANIYDVAGNISTSLIHRTFSENLLFHIENIKRWQKVKTALENSFDIFQKVNYSWKEKLAECEKTLGFSADNLFSPESFINYINQSGIDKYNSFIGGVAAEGGKTKIKGLNEFINLSRQQAGAKSKQFPNLKPLYKQILSRSDKNFIETFDEDKAMFETISDFQKAYFDENITSSLVIPTFIKEIKELSNNLINESENIFIAKDKLNNISLALTGSWNSISNQLLAQSTESKFQKASRFSVHEIDNALKHLIENLSSTNDEGNPIKSEYRNLSASSDNLIYDFFNKHLDNLYTATIGSWQKLHGNGVLAEQNIDAAREDENDKGFEQIACIKAFLDNCIALLNFIKDWNLKINETPDEAFTDWYDKIQHFIDNFPIINLYNKTRNYVTKKPYSSDKIKINFEKSTLLDGWDRNKETANFGTILEKDGNFYLAVMTPGFNGVFDYDIAPDESPKKSKEKEVLKKAVIATSGEPSYRKMNYKLLPGPNKMLPKVFFAQKNINFFNPSAEVVNIKEQKLYSKTEIEKHGIENLHKYIDFCKNSLCIHPEWKEAYGFSENSFRKTEEYESVDQFYREVEEKGYKISFDNIKESYIHDNVEKGQLYLFKIYNKDFSTERKKERERRDNLHTSYWKLLFAEENLNDIVLKLNGQAEIFFRKASVKWSEDKMQKGHHHEELKDKFSYPIIKDRRFTQDKFFFHCPITLNHKAPSQPGRFNSKVRQFLKNNPSVNIIGIDRGEKHLLYYSVIKQNGDIIEQGSLNQISNGFIPSGETKAREIDYHQKLEEKEKNRDKARKSWSAIENIKELKAGYLSQVVHKLSQLIIKHNAIVVLEDLNKGFKRGRFKVEKQVYQKFEKALIEKLNYLVFKDRENRLEPGHYLNAYQLTNKFTSFKELGKQSGILFYTIASYTSTTDPVSGFIKNVYNNYSSVAKSIELWESFDSIIYNSEKDRFEFSYTIDKILSKKMEKEKDENQIDRKQWTVVSSVIRSRYVKQTLAEEQKLSADREKIGNKGTYELFSVTEKLKKLFKENNIDYQNENNIQKQLVVRSAKGDSSLHKSCIYYFNAILNMRVTDSQKNTGSDENDFILSPVEPFFDSRKKYQKLPVNGDANGAYNIARKGICLLDKINNAENLDKVNLTVTKRDWQNYTQSQEMLACQIKKMN